MIIVCSLADQKNICQSVNASHLISVVDPGYQPETPHNIHNHLKLGFDVSTKDNGDGGGNLIIDTFLTCNTNEDLFKFLIDKYETISIDMLKIEME